jgi:hypothetical protein
MAIQMEMGMALATGVIGMVMGMVVETWVGCLAFCSMALGDGTCHWLAHDCHCHLACSR